MIEDVSSHIQNITYSVSNISRHFLFPVENIPGTSKTVQVVMIDTTLLCFYSKM